MNIANAIAGSSPDEIVFEVHRGGRFVVFQYCFSIVVMSFRLNTEAKFLKAGESAITRSLPYTLLSLVFGWWGIPWGFIFTPQVLYRNLKGGTDVTGYVLANLQNSAPPAPPSSLIP